MSLYKIVFSPTGTTDKVAEILMKDIAQDLRQACHMMDLSDIRKDFSQIVISQEDTCIIAVPSFGGRVPEVAAQRLRTINGNGANAVIVAVYGNRAFEDTLAELQDIAEDSGFKVIAGIAAVAEHSIAREFAHGRPDKEDEKALHNMAEKIIGKLKSEKPVDNKRLVLPGDRPYKKYGVIKIDILTNERCTGCGTCAVKCPVGAIDKKNPSKTNGDICIYCMRCISMCPVKARFAEPQKVEFLKSKISRICDDRKEYLIFL